MLGKEACQRFCDLAKTHGLDIVVGTIIERDPDDNHLYNCAYYIDKDGKVLLEYRKVHLWHPERDYLHKGGVFTRLSFLSHRCVKHGNLYRSARFQHGQESLWNHNGHLCLLGHCLSRGISAHGFGASCAAHYSARYIPNPVPPKSSRAILTRFLSAYWTLEDGGPVALTHDPQCEAKMIDYIVGARAFENEICMVFCNAANGSDEQPKPPFGTLTGCTQIAVPFKGPVAHASGTQEEMVVADVDVEQLTADVERVYLIRKDWHEGKVFGGKTEQEVETITKQKL